MGFNNPNVFFSFPSIPVMISIFIGNGHHTLVLHFEVSQIYLFYSSVTMLVCLTGMILLYICAFYSPLPKHLSFLTPIRTLAFAIFRTQAVLQIVFYLACLTHFIEALYSTRVMHRKGLTNSILKLKWFLLVVAFGWPGVMELNKLEDKDFSVKTK